MVCALLAAPAAPAATLSVDDDRQDCTGAGFTAVQDAIDAAAPGDTIAICPGHYAEGNGLPNTSALKIDKTLTLKGAGADLVTISPVRYDGNDGVIAEDPQNIRYPSGNIITAVGTPAVPITVDISGVTVDGDGVAAKAGVVFLDAQGSLRRSRVTDIVTSESPAAYGMPGGYRSNYLGYGVAQVTAAATAPVGAGPRTLAISNTRIDEYNRAGVLIDGGINSAIPVTASGLDLRGVISTSQIVGRQQCWDTNVDGDCGGPNPPGNPDPKPIPDGPLFGQDGVRLAAGARGAISGSLISQNLVQGTGAPVRNSATNNANLRQGAGIRLVGGDAANSSVTRTNVVDNAYGIVNAAADNAADAANPLLAENNWWGLCSPVGSNRCNGEPPGNTQPPNNGPAVSPTTNPGYPENPVNGVAAPEGSTTVDFRPYRSGPQSDPNSGQFPVVPAPIPVSDAAPAVTVTTERADYFPGETVLITAVPSDDFGIRQVTFFNGATDLGSDKTPAYSAAFTLPKGAACGNRTVSATAEDSLGQTASGTAAFKVVCDDGGTLQPPTVQIPNNVNNIPREGRTVTVEPNARQGVASVDFFLGNRLVCHDTGAPFGCLIKPLATESGKQTLRVVVTDRAGLTGEDEREVQVPKAGPKKVQVTVEREALSRTRVRRIVSVTVVPPAGVSRAVACGGMRITAVVRHRGRTVLNRQIKLDSACRAVLLRSTIDARKRGPRYKASVRFGGSTVLATAQKTRRFR
jgi:hypothetical protein